MPFIGKRKEGIWERRKGSLPFSLPSALPPLSWSCSAAWRLRTKFGHNNRKGSAGHDREEFAMSSSYTHIAHLTGCSLLFLHYMLYLPAIPHCKTAPVVRTSRTMEWSNKRPGASSRAKIKCNSSEIREKYAFFHSLYTSRSSRALRENLMGVPLKKKDFNERPWLFWGLLPCLHTQGVGTCTPLTTVVPS